MYQLVYYAKHLLVRFCENISSNNIEDFLSNHCYRVDITKCMEQKYNPVFENEYITAGLLYFDPINFLLAYKDKYDSIVEIPIFKTIVDVMAININYSKFIANEFTNNLNGAEEYFSQEKYDREKYAKYSSLVIAFDWLISSASLYYDKNNREMKEFYSHYIPYTSNLVSLFRNHGCRE